MSGRPLRSVPLEARAPRRQYDDFVTRIQTTGRWTWGCNDPLHHSLAEGMLRDYATREAAQRVLDVHRRVDDAERLRTVCTCRECEVHGAPWVALDQQKFGEPNPRTYATTPTRPGVVRGTDQRSDRDE